MTKLKRGISASSTSKRGGKKLIRRHKSPTFKGKPTAKLTNEKHVWKTSLSSGEFLVAGVDEVGRGSLAGPVVAAVVCWGSHQPQIEGVNDSKKLTERQRTYLAKKIKENALDWAVGYASVQEIDKLNILQATFLAMKRSFDALSLTPHHILVDGTSCPSNAGNYSFTPIPQGDSHSYTIAAASIIAKVERDIFMTKLADENPEFECWKSSKGYATKEHRSKIRELGLTIHHRQTFCSNSLKS